MSQTSNSTTLAVGLLSSAVPFLRIVFPPPLHGSGDMHEKVCRSEGKNLANHCSVRAIRAGPGAQPDEIFSPLQSSGLSGECVLCFYHPSFLSTFFFFINPRKIQSTALILQQSPTSHSYSQNSVVCYHW